MGGRRHRTLAARTSATREEPVAENGHEIRVCHIEAEVDLRKHSAKRIDFAGTEPVAPALFDELWERTPTLLRDATDRCRLNEPGFACAFALRVIRWRTQFDVAPPAHSINVRWRSC